MEHLRNRIEEAGGSISFERFMEAALYTPRLGYYSAGSSKFAAAGDFVTAPTLSPLFSGCVARQIERLLRAMGCSSVLEIGAGTGDMAAVVAQALAELGTPCTGYRILERSADLIERQQARLEGAGHGLTIEWLDALPEPGFQGVVVANELLDALSVARFELDAGERFEWHVELDRRGAFAWARRPPGPELARQLGALVDELRAGPWANCESTPWLEAAAPLRVPYTSEIGIAACAWVAELATRLTKGALLLFDYGYARQEYYHSQRRAGTLRCHYRHRAFDDPLWRPGLCDISAHVDFTAVARAGVAGGLALAGFASQADFLLSTGLLDEAARSRPDSPEFAELTGQIKRLTLPGEMGEAVKVMALTRGLEAGEGSESALRGLRARDRRGRLGV
ncbi:MAG: class I SAM-dependent methyltransferase [Gammaproteobacteria bacterium]